MKAVLASSNRGKLEELEVLLSPAGWELTSQSTLGIEPAPETGVTFVENALQKARHASRASGLPAIADDSGIVVDALGGAPGIYSARYAGVGATDQDNNRKLISALAGISNRAAHYYCAIVFVRSADDPAPLISTGRWDGSIAEEPRGSGGFGYDPHFVVAGGTRTAAELSNAEKNAVSHRGIAVRALATQLAGA